MGSAIVTLDRAEMAMGWVHPWVGLGCVDFLWNAMGWVGLRNIKLVRWGKRAGLLSPM